MDPATEIQVIENDVISSIMEREREGAHEKQSEYIPRGECRMAGLRLGKLVARPSHATHLLYEVKQVNIHSGFSSLQTHWLGCLRSLPVLNLI